MKPQWAFVGVALALAGCNGNAFYGPQTPLAQHVAVSHAGGAVSARFVEGSPLLAQDVGGVEQDLGTATLSVNGQTVATFFTYGTLTQFVSLPSGTVSVRAFNSVGYSIGPFTTTISAGKSYSIVLVGTYPHYKLLAFPEPAPGKGAALSLYSASPGSPNVSFGRYQVAGKSCGGAGKQYHQLGSARLGAIATVALGSHVTRFGAYAGNGTKPFAGASVTPCSVNAFDVANALPFENAARLSLFVLDSQGGGSTPSVVGSLDL